MSRRGLDWGGRWITYWLGLTGVEVCLKQISHSSNGWVIIIIPVVFDGFVLNLSNIIIRERCLKVERMKHFETYLDMGVPWVFLLKMIILGCFGGTTI